MTRRQTLRARPTFADMARAFAPVDTPLAQLAKGYVATDGETGQFLALTGDHDLLILDVMLPGRDGWQILQAVRQAGTEAIRAVIRDTQ